MTKIKNTKKGMAKKTLSMSLVVAMLATSNVPVWAAEFSDGTDAAVTSETSETSETEAPAVDTTEEFSADTVETPVVEDTTEDVEVATAASDYDFSGITVNDKAKNATWAKKTATFATITAENVFGTSKIQRNGADYTGTGLQYTWAYNGAWDKTGLAPLNNAEVKSAVTLPDATILKAHVNEAWSLIIVENGSTTPIANISLGTIQPVNVADTGVSIGNVAAQTYDGTEKKPEVNLNGNAGSDYNAELNNKANYSWSYSGSDGLVNAGSVVTIAGTYTGADADCYTGTLTNTFKIGKFDLSTGKAKIIVKAATPDKEFTYAGKNNLQVDNSEVNVYLASANDNSVASDVLLNDFVKKVTVDASAVKDNATFTVTFDASKINASSNFKVADKTDFTQNSLEKYDEKTNTVKIMPLDLAGVTVTLKNPLKINNVTAGTYTDTSNLVFTKDGKELALSGDVSASIAKGDYTQPGTYTGAITIAAKTSNVKGSTVANLVVKTNVFGTNAGFKNSTASRYLTTNKNDVNNLTGLDYNNGSAVEFKSTDLFTEKADALLGWFDPTGTSAAATDQSYFRVKYSDNVNATGAKVGVLTVYAVGGDYEGCSKDFYFKINPSTVNPTNTSATTVTTAVTKDIAGVSIKEANNKDAAAYADAIGLVVKGTNDPAGSKEAKDRITSDATTNDYKVEYSFVKKTNPAETGSNSTDSYVKAVITLKKNGNFKVGNAVSALTQLGKENTGVKYTVTAATANDNGTVTLYVPIVEKSVSDLDISLDQTSYVFTGTTIEPKVSVKLNGKAFDEGTDYTVSVKNGINVGTADVVVTLKESTGYKGSKTLSATITPAKLSDVKFAIKSGDSNKQVYDATPKKPLIAQVDNPATTKDEGVSESSANAQVKLGSVVISEMFDITYGENINAGKDAGTVTLTPKASAAKNFDGSSVTATFDIERQTLKNKTAGWAVKLVNDDGVIISKGSNNALSASDTDMEWTGKDTVFANSSLVASNIEALNTSIRKNDYTYELAYANNVETTTASAPAFVCVVGTGNYGGTYSIVKAKNGAVTAELTADVEAANKKNPGTYEVLLDNVLEGSYASFQIEGRTFSAKNVTITNATYAGGVAVKPGSVVKDSKTGKVLTEGTDYELVFDTKNVDVTTTPIAVSVKGIGQYKGSLVNSKADGSKLTFTIDKKDLKDCYVNVDKKDGNLDLTVMNDNVVEKKENFDVKDNGDGTATVSVVDGGKNYTGSVTVEIADSKVGTALISDVVVKGNTVTPVLSSEVDAAVGYDYVIATEEDYANGRVDISKNVLSTHTNFNYVQAGTYYAYCHAWKRGADGKKVFGEWSNLYKFEVKATTPSTPTVTSVKVKGSTVTVTYTASEDATGYDVVLGTSVKKVNGERRPVEYGKLVKKNVEEGTVEVTFTNVPSGTYYAGLHAYNRTSANASKVFSKWSNHKTVRVK